MWGWAIENYLTPTPLSPHTHVSAYLQTIEQKTKNNEIIFWFVFPPSILKIGSHPIFSLFGFSHQRPLNSSPNHETSDMRTCMDNDFQGSPKLLLSKTPRRSRDSQKLPKQRLPKIPQRLPEGLETPKGSQKIPKDPETPRGSQRLPEAPRNSQSLLEAPRSSQMFPEAPRDSQRLPRGSQRLAEAPRGFQRLPEAPGGSQGAPESFWELL